MSDAVTRVAVEIAGKEISFETGKMAKQASGSVVVQAGETMVLGTATAGNLRDVDFLPLTVDIEERMYAAGKIPGSFFKREGRAGEKGTLTARLIDRPIRPLFPKGWRYETQLVSIPLSVDHVNPYDILAMNGASAALMVSDIPFPTPGRRGAHRQDRRQLRRQPRRGGPAREHRPRSDRGRHRGGHPDGRGGRQRDSRGGDPRRARHRARRDQEALQGPVGAAEEGRQGQEGRRRPAGRREALQSDPEIARQKARQSDLRRRTSSIARTRRRPSRSRCSRSTRPTPRTR